MKREVVKYTRNTSCLSWKGIIVKFIFYYFYIKISISNHYFHQTRQKDWTHFQIKIRNMLFFFLNKFWYRTKSGWQICTVRTLANHITPPILWCLPFYFLISSIQINSKRWALKLKQGNIATGIKVNWPSLVISMRFKWKRCHLT